MTMRVFLLGYPDAVGGASTEALHTVKLWRRFGVEVNAIPTWGEPPLAMRAAMDDAGAITHVVRPAVERVAEHDRECMKRGASCGSVTHEENRCVLLNDLRNVPNLEGSVIVSFCNSAFFPAVPLLKKLGCRLVWSPCMTWMFDKEKEALRDHGLFDAWHFQSNYQREMLEPYLREFGYDSERGHLIRGAFDTTGWDFKPLSHQRQTPFVLGKLARCDADKWSSNYFSIFKTILYREKRLYLMGYSSLAHRKLGDLPTECEWLKPNAMPAQEYYGKIHCLWTINGGAAENWPRVGLEAMAAGVPIVTENRWGWTEMIDHGETGFLADDDEAMAFFASLLAHDERLRIKIANQAREKLESVLARPDHVWQGWHNIFRKLGA